MVWEYIWAVGLKAQEGPGVWCSVEGVKCKA